MVAPLEITIAGIPFKNPVMVASGTFGYGLEMAPHVDLNRLGGVVVKGISLQPRQGNPPARVCETAAGMLNAIGLQNVGLKAFLEEKLPGLGRYDTRVIVNIFGETVEEYVAVAEGLRDVDGVDALEINASCPNVKAGGMLFGTDPAQFRLLLKALRRTTNKPLIAKLTPNVTRISEFARVAEEEGMDAVSLVNTFVGMAVDAETRRPMLSHVTGGLSGPAIKPQALWMVWQVSRAVALPIIGMGGIVTATDAVEFLLAGATAVAVGTATFVNPKASLDVVEGLEQYLERHGIGHVRELVGALRLGEGPDA